MLLGQRSGSSRPAKQTTVVLNALWYSYTRRYKADGTTRHETDDVAFNGTTHDAQCVGLLIVDHRADRSRCHEPAALARRGHNLVCRRLQSGDGANGEAPPG